MAASDNMSWVVIL